ncbi:CMRF35-like molecule 3 [Oncorhynchus kisutch]|uniref:CMRF35-like molecule 3 n=1 Tax=Oncorhynchus kisutch TaxID=8019 RepID=A0A8C7H977_ONCKI|nr:CMRF35-like molecule 3 [Oncorhynchus kisutch]
MVSRLSFSLLLIFSRLSGTDWIRLMSVWTGDSIALPCIYHQDYLNHVKYWCKGDSWITCSYVVRTDHPNSSGKTSISDAVNLRTFTVTMKSLEQSDSDIYWCVVEKNGPDEWLELFKLVITDSPIVDQEETGVEGGSVFTSIPTIQEMFAVQTTTQFTTTITMPMPTTQELSVMTGEYALSSSTSQASVNNTHHGAQRCERTLFYLPKTVNAVVFLLCTIMAVVKYRTNHVRGQTDDE